MTGEEKRGIPTASPKNSKAVDETRRGQNVTGVKGGVLEGCDAGRRRGGGKWRGSG